jgi:uncharacterized membrane protein YhaH (DUF805 family)
MAVGSEVPGHKLGERRSRWWWLLYILPIVGFLVVDNWTDGSAWVMASVVVAIVVMLVFRRWLVTQLARPFDVFR